MILTNEIPFADIASNFIFSIYVMIWPEYQDLRKVDPNEKQEFHKTRHREKVRAQTKKNGAPKTGLADRAYRNFTIRFGTKEP